MPQHTENTENLLQTYKKSYRFTVNLLITNDVFYMFIFIRLERVEIVGGGLCVCVCVIFIVVTEVCRVHSYTCSLKQQEV